MAEIWSRMNNVIWSRSFWLPRNVTWDELKNIGDGIYHPQFSDLLVPVYLSVVVYIVRSFFERYILGPIGHSYGLKVVSKKAPSNPILENAFRLKKLPSLKTVQDLAKQTGLTSRHVERWFRIRRNQDKTPVLKKFVESVWRGLFYCIIFWYGIYIHIDKPWFYETIHAWKGWPHHHVSDDLYWYYMVEGAFYINLLFSLFTDHKRKDFAEMAVHHVATLILMGMSWISNFVRIGTLILLVHDAVDSWMEAAKVAKYLGYDKICETLFFIFMIVWIITRMIIYPFRIIRSTMFEALEGIEEREPNWCTMYSFGTMLLCILQVLHVIWFYYICIIASDAFKGQMKKDSRSSCESTSDSEEKKQKPIENHTNHGIEEKNSKTNSSVNDTIKMKVKKTS